MSSGILSSLKQIERHAVRAVLIDDSGSILLLSTRDASNPDFIDSWELPGGGIHEGEPHAEAITRELFEETGLKINPQSVREPQWIRDVHYSYRGERRLQHEAISVVALSVCKPDIDYSDREPFELEDHLEYHWWSVEELTSSTATFYPRNLARHIESLLRGEHIQDPIEHWD
ncbi:NUDIX hydrolase [Serratia quinivorans]|uniref:NUDIX hydrolase n=1 Tax=Serratia quinivorans TaxID=137545 RepID=UPI0021796F8F|nr:NUDIX domain-containing protein [Serratia quinivorans]CAI0793015.1 mutator mutT protein [Serratia quinivorans]CAI0819177.1 mutator mutT protein [Serratia quinivorans]CAI1728236.1 mutator mutT protein [Serratia quinivorans]CAI2066287.1 mutator mutT protein [Serratia quinivorans]CAI2113968.1 mutator mutT protein [Serratia quinivorans]